MGLFSGKKKTYSGVGSAVQNLISSEPESSLVTTVVSSKVNSTDLSESIKNSLASGNGTKLRSAIDYAHQKGYTNTLNWRVSNITGEVFSDSTAYVNYLQTYVYPSSASTSTTPETVVSDRVTNQVSYRLGNDEVTEKTYTRTTTKTVTTTSTTYSPIVNLYYQGSHTEYLAINNMINSDVYKSLPDQVKDTALAISGYINVCFHNSDSRGQWTTYPNATLFLMPHPFIGQVGNVKYYANIPTTVEGNLLATCIDVGSQTVTITVEETGQDWNYYWYEKNITLMEYLSEETDVYNYLPKHKYMCDPIGTLGLDTSNAINICEITFCIGAHNYNDAGEDSRQNYVADIQYFKGYALVCANASTSASKVLIGNVTFTKNTTRLTSTITSEYVITEKYLNGVLTSSTTEEGAKSTASTQETLENTTFTHQDNYTYGSGNSNFDAIINNTSSITEQFFPIFPIKTWGTLCNSSWGDLYTKERLLYRKLTGKNLSTWDDFLESFKDVGDDAKMIYYWPSIPINVDTDFTNEYLFHFFKWLAVNFNGMSAFGSSLTFGLWADDNVDFNVGYSFKIIYKVVSGTPPIPCKTHGYARYYKLAGKEDDDCTSTSWQGGFRDNYRRYLHAKYANLAADSSYLQGSAEDYPSLTADQYNSLQNSNTHTYSVWASDDETSSMTLYYKINNELYEKVYITNFLFTHYVRGTGLTYLLKNSLSKNWRTAIDEEATNTANAGFSPIIIPIARGVLESMGWYRQSNILEFCHNVIISGYEQKTIKTKWYQSAFFSFVLIIVIVIITIYCAPAGAAAGSAAGGGGAASGAAGAAAAGATAGTGTFCGITMNAMAAMALKGITCALICKAITYTANKLIGGVAGTIIGAVASVVACYYASGFIDSFNTTSMVTNTQSFWEVMNTPKGWLQLTSAVVDAANNYSTQKWNAKLTAANAAYATQVENQQQMMSELNKAIQKENSYRHEEILDTAIENTYATTQYAAEDPDTFFSRTDGSMDPSQLTFDYVANFEEYKNSLELN